MIDPGRLPAGFEEAFDPLFRRAFVVGRRILSDPVAAEDVAAEALARAFAHWRKIGGQPWREGWVVRVATNLALDAARSRTRRGDRSLDQGLAEGMPVPALGGDPGADAASDAVVVRLALVEALRALPRRQREAVSLRYLAGLSEVEVAEALQVSAGSVKTHLHRGVARLRERLGSDEPLGVEEVVAHG